MTSRSPEAVVQPAAATTTMDAEPVGIVISRGDREQPVPAFWAYVWSAAPEVAKRRPRKSKAA